MKKKVLSFVMAVTMIVGCLASGTTTQAATKLEEPKIGLSLTDNEDSLYAKISFSGNCMTKSTLAYRKHQKKQNTKYVFSGIGKSKIANGYKIQRKKNNGKYTTIKTVKLTKKKSKYYLNLTYKDSTILRGNTYTYRVVLYKMVGSKTILKKSLTKQITVKKKIEENIEPDVTNNNNIEDEMLTADQMKHYNDGFEPKMLKVINQYRAEKGLKPMVLDTRLCEAARQRLVEELQEDEIGNPTGVHMRPSYRPFYYIFTPLGIKDIAPRGENWIQNFDHIVIPPASNKEYYESWYDWYYKISNINYRVYGGGWDDALIGLLQSPGHYEIMMGELNDCFGAAFVQKGNRIYWMQEFGTYGTNYFYGEE